ncbi:MAG: amidohydrolase family protein [Gemmatimonadaceae bacterium]
MRPIVRLTSIVLALASLAAPAFVAGLPAQQPDTLSTAVRRYVTVNAPIVALTRVTVIDGTGAPAKHDQTIVIRNGRIAAVGARTRVQIPQGATVLDLPGHTVIPGIVGMHDHLFYTAAGGRASQMTYTAPRLYLAAGVTTIRTTGSRAPYAEINTKQAIDGGLIPGPRIHLTAPYITGAAGGGSMAVVDSPEAARRFVAYWGSEGMTWLKAYTDIRGADLAAAIDEAHKRGMKVTGHLCSVSFQEAVAFGIDNLEHGMLTATDFDPQRTPDVCTASNLAQVSAGTANPTGPAGQATIRRMIDNRVSMTSTLAVYEPFMSARPNNMDPRTLEMMAPEVRESYLRIRHQIDSAGGRFTLAALKNGMAFEKAFFDAGGVLASGVDPTGIGGALPGFGDQRNYELLIEAGFTPEQTVRIMSANGAKILGVYDRLGSVEPGKLADLVVLAADLRAGPAGIRNVTTVFKNGVGYDSRLLIAAVKGRIGID